VSGPEPTERSQPGIHLLKWFRFQSVETALCVRRGFHETGLAQALAGALTRSAAAYEVDARSLQPTVVTRPRGSISRGGSAPQRFRTQIPLSSWFRTSRRETYPNWFGKGCSSSRHNPEMPQVGCEGSPSHVYRNSPGTISIERMPETLAASLKTQRLDDSPIPVHRSQEFPSEVRHDLGSSTPRLPIPTPGEHFADLSRDVLKKSAFGIRHTSHKSWQTHTLVGLSIWTNSLGTLGRAPKSTCLPFA
jgi:hypothetical protein